MFERHLDKNGETGRKHGNTLIGLRNTTAPILHWGALKATD